MEAVKLTLYGQETHPLPPRSNSISYRQFLIRAYPGGVRGRRSLAHHYGGSLQFRQSLLLTGKIVRLSICPPLSASPDCAEPGFLHLFPPSAAASEDNLLRKERGGLDRRSSSNNWCGSQEAATLTDREREGER